MASSREVLSGLVRGFREQLDAAGGSPAARASIADLERHFADDVHLTPAQMADYRVRLTKYATAQADLPFSPLGAA